MTVTRKTLALAAATWLVVAGISLGQAPAKKGNRGRDEVWNALANAHEIRGRIAALQDQNAKDAAEQEFKKLVAKYREAFPEIPATVGEKAHYTKLNLNSRGAGFDAVRFRVPTAGRTYQMHLAFGYPGTVKTHNIAAIGFMEAGGDTLILTYPETKENVELTGMNLPEPNWWSSYRLYGRKLQPGKECLFWFDLKANEPFPVFVRLRIEPLETAEPPHTPALQTARTTFQAALAKMNDRYDEDDKTIRRKYLAELDRAGKAVSKKNAASRPELLAEADRANLGGSEASDPRGFRIIRAEIGVNDQWNDITVQARDFVREHRLKVNSPEYDFQPDAAFGVSKTLVIVYTVDGKPGIYAAPADRKVELPPTAEAAAKK